MTALFSKKNKDKDKEPKKETKAVETVETPSENSEEVAMASLSADELAKAGAGTHKILKGFYVSEKSSMGYNDGQYTFRVSPHANKSEVKKEVSKLFNVKIKNVKIMNMPEKRRDFGKHPGARSGFKKAIVVLEEGYTIGQAKP